MAKKKIEKLIPLMKVAEEFGVDRQTIANWQDDGLLNGTVINRNRFITRSSIEKLKGEYPECAIDANKIDEYKIKLKNLKSELRLLRKERIYRNYAPRYIAEFIKRLMSFMEKMDVEDRIRYKHIKDMHERIFHYWLFNHDADELYNEITPYERQMSAKVYSKILRKMDNYEKLFLENRMLKSQMGEMDLEISRLNDDIEYYSKLHESIKAIEDRKNEGVGIKSCLNLRLKDLDISVRTLRILECNNIETVGQLIRYNKSELIRLRNFGKKSLTELDDLLESMSLSFGMGNVDERLMYKPKL